MLSSFVSSVSIGETGLFYYIMFVNTVKQNVNTVEECVNKAENDMGIQWPQKDAIFLC